MKETPVTASHFLQEKKLEFLRNVVRHIDFDLPGIGFFRDIAALVPSVDEARALCRDAFRADGKDSLGRPLLDDGEVLHSRELSQILTSKPAEEGEQDEMADAAILARVARAARDGGPFRRDRPLAEGFRDAWRSTGQNIGNFTRLAAQNLLRRRIADLVKKRLDEMTRRRPRHDPGLACVDGMVRDLGLSLDEGNLLVFLYLFRSRRCDWFRHIAAGPATNARDKVEARELFALATGLKYSSVGKALSANGTLVRRNIVSKKDYSLSTLTMCAFDDAEAQCRARPVAPRNAAGSSLDTLARILLGANPSAK